MESIENILLYKQKQLDCKLSEIEIDHPVTKGEHCEGAWIKYLKSFLPARYGVTKGFVFDSKGGISKQIDIIIYDTLYSPLIFELDSGEKYVTAESVYAVFDSKQEVTKETVIETDEKIESVRKLFRTSRGMYCAGKEMPPRELTPILGGILAKKITVSDKTFKNYMESYKNIDLGCIVQGYAFLNFRKNGKVEIQKSSSEETAFAFYYILNNELFKLGTVQAIDIREYAKLSLKSFNFISENMMI